MALPTESRSDLTWLAFRYVAGELTGDEVVIFERRLAQDQSAREAVAEAVELSGAIAAPRPEAPTTLPMARRRAPHPVWLALVAGAAAACLAVVVGLSSRGPKRPESSVTPPRAAIGPAEKVALAWSGLRQESDRAEDGSDDLITWLAEPGPAPVEPAGAVHGPPVWLIEAAALGDRARGPKEN